MIKGLELHEDFITAQEEQDLIAAFYGDGYPFSRINRRFVKHYGHTYEYKKFGVSETPTPPFPAFFDEFLERIQALLPPDYIVDQMTVQEYPAKSGISPHVDTTVWFGSHIVVLNLQSAITMHFSLDPLQIQDEANGHANSDETIPKPLLENSDFWKGRARVVTAHNSKPPQFGQEISVYLTRRSLLILSDEARYKYRHSIRERMSDTIIQPGNDGELQHIDRGVRLSVTLRKIINGEEEGGVKIREAHKSRCNVFGVVECV